MIKKIIKTHSVQNGHAKKTLTFSTEENNLSNETQALPLNQSPTFYSPNSPVAYGFWDDLGKGISDFGNGVIKGITRPDKAILELMGLARAAESSHSPDIKLYSELTLL